MKLATRYFVAFAAVATSAFITLGVIDAVGSYHRDLTHLGELQRAQAHVVATRIAAYLDAIAMQLAEVKALPWSSGFLGDEDRRDEFHRLLKVNPAIHELRLVTADGGVASMVSRVALDDMHLDTPWPLQERYAADARRGSWYGPVYFKEGSTPYVSLAVRDPRTGAPDLLVAEINLGYVTDLIASMHLTGGGRAFVVDGTNHLIAHPNRSLLHRKVDLDGMPQVVAARARNAATGEMTEVAQSPDTGGEVLTSAILIAAPGWLVFVEQPLSEVMAPVRAAIYRTLVLLVVLLMVGLVVSRWLANKLTRPIVALERGAAQIAAGDLSVRVTSRTSDEIEALAAEFNRMAASVGRSHAELESLVQQRTGELGEAHRKVQAQADEVACLNQELQLRLAELAIKKEEAERANAAKTRFLAAASHDLRQPMQAISLLMEVLRERITGRDVRLLAEKVQASVHALETLFVSLLDISRLDAGVIKPQWQEFRIDSLLLLLEGNFLPQALAKGLKLTVVHSDAAVRSDPALLERILSNLVSNAIRYTSSGRILIGCRRRGDRLHILVHDTGSGIPANLHEEIFEEFFQIANPERDRSKGLGLGLSIVKRTAEILDHRLLMRSQPGRGSMFGIDVPLARMDAKMSAPQFAAPDRNRLLGMFVVVIDDDCENRFAIETLCAQWGCHVVGAASGEAAVAKLQSHLRSPDLIISDYRLRFSETGTAAVARVREIVEERVPAIIITGDMTVHAGTVTGDGRTALLYKPINAEKLWNVADKLLSVARTSTDPAPS